MEIATGTATDLVGKILGFAGSTVGRQVRYLICYKRNLKNLETELNKLSDAKDTVSTKITVAEAKGEKIYSGVQVWLENVARITKEAKQLLKDKQQATVEDANNSTKDDGQPKTKCVHWFCPNLVLRRRRNKKSLELVKGVTNMINEAKALSDISYVPPKGPKDLETEVDKLRVAKKTLAEKVAAAKGRGETIHANVQDWLKKVAEITEAAEEFLKDKHQSVEEATEFSKEEIQAIEKPNASLSHGSNELLELLQGVTELYEKRDFPDISFEPPKDLQTEVEKLSVAKETLAEEVAAAEVKGEKIHANVLDWLKRVTEIVKKAEEYLKDKHRSTEDASEFMKDDIQAIEKPNTSLSLGSKESTELLLVVTELYEMREFSKISYILQPKDKCMASDQYYEEFDSRSSIVEKILKELRSTSSSDMILVSGIGGVGKTTLVEEVLRKAQKEKLFQDAVMVRDVKVPNLEAIQKQIADKLGLKNILEAHTLHGRADKINERIMNKKVLFIFDDVWGEIDLKAVGLPLVEVPTIPDNSTCRILLTSRIKKIFSHEIKQKEFQLGVLNDDEAWALFEKKAGHVVADPTIGPVAAQVAKKCGGLPVLVITVARALQNKTDLRFWKNALEELERFDETGDLSHLTDKAYSGIEWSYTQLSHKERLQSLFLLCGSIAMGNNISLTTLLKYSIGLGFFQDRSVEEARNALYKQVDKLKSCCLLLDGDDGTCVRMHDLVRDVANRIARRDQHALVEDGGHNKLEKWPDEEFFIECSKICLPCCKIAATLQQVPWKCPQLELFHLVREEEEDDDDDDDDDDAYSEVDDIDDDDDDDDDAHSEVDDNEDDGAVGEIPNNFFEEMKKLKVLGLRSVLLPSSVSFLKNLKTLCLDGCYFEDTNLALVGELRNLEVLSMVRSAVRQLPQEFGQLTRLRLVDLSDCFSLKVIPAGVISNWKKLEDLRLRNSFDKWEGTAKEYESEESDSETSIASLSELMNLPNLTALEVRIPDDDILPPKLFSDRLKNYQIFLGGHFGLMEETTLNTLKLQHHPRYELNENVKILLKKCDIFTVNGGDFSFLMKTKVVMSHLTTLDVTSCDGFKYLFTSSMVRSLVKLKYLKVHRCPDMEEIISTKESHEEDVDNMFAKLERLTLLVLPNFARFCTAGSCIDFPLLEELHVEGCPKLGKSATYWGNILFDEKVRFPRLEILKITKYDQDTVLKKIWHNQLAPDSFCRLREFHLDNCSGVSSIFPPSMTGRLSGLETLVISRCASAGMVFEESGESTSTTTTDLKDCQNLKSVLIYECHKLRYVFPASMVNRGLQHLQELELSYCKGMRNVVGKEEGAVESTTHPRFIFPKVKVMTFDSMDILESFYPAMHTSEWPSLQHFEFSRGSLVTFAAEVSHFQETQLHAPTKQPFFLIDKGSFPVLEELVLPDFTEILYGPSLSPVELMFPKLNSIRRESELY